jgi:ABC-type dipeptide/oligopeptide/nickel transport system permease component
MEQRRMMLWLILRRVAFLPVAVFLAITGSFALVTLVPGDPAKVIAGSAASPAEVSSVSHRLGLNQSFFARYWHYLDGLLHGNMGNSYYTALPVRHQIAIRLPATLELIVPSLVVAAAIALVAGIVAAARHGRPVDHALSGVISFFQGMPDFLLGNIFIFVLFFELHLFASPTGQLGLGQSPPPHHTGAYVLDAMLSGNWTLAGQAASHLILPVLTLSLAVAAPLARTTRAAFIEAMESPALDYAKSLGLPKRVIWLYVWREARGPILTFGAFIFAGLIGGDAIVEIVFSWGGLGSWSVSSIEQLDMPVTEGFVVVVATATIVVYLLLDMLQLALDPRLRAAAEEQEGIVGRVVHLIGDRTHRLLPAGA